MALSAIRLARTRLARSLMSAPMILSPWLKAGMVGSKGSKVALR